MRISSWRAATPQEYFGYPDDDEACIQHGNNADTCPACFDDFQREQADFEVWRATQPAPMTEIPSDLPL